MLPGRWFGGFVKVLLGLHVAVAAALEAPDKAASVLYENSKGDKLWRACRSKGIELKIEMKNWSGLSYVKEATEVVEGAAIPEELTRPPAAFVARQGHGATTRQRHGARRRASRTLRIGAVDALRSRARSAGSSS
jgi:hypothetical protein